VLQGVVRSWPDSAGSQLSAIAAAESAALTSYLLIASEDVGRLNLYQETNGQRARCTLHALPRQDLQPAGIASLQTPLLNQVKSDTRQRLLMWASIAASGYQRVRHPLQKRYGFAGLEYL
jgi:hypothetical protein